MNSAGVDRERFSRTELAEVLSHYDVGVIKSAKEFSRGSRRAPKLLLETDHKRYLLKRRAAGRNDPFKVAFAHALMMHLQIKGFPLPAVIVTCDHHDSMLELQGHVYELFEFITGQRYDASLEQTERAGRALAHYHQAVADFATEWTPPAGSYHDAPTVRAGLNAIPTVTAGHNSVFGHEAAILQLTQVLHEHYDEAAAAVNQTRFATWPITIIHGDWHPGNMLFHEGEVCAVLDFDAARHQPHIIDMAYGVLQFSILRGSTAPDQWPDFFDETRMRRFMAGYADLRPVPRDQREVIPHLMIEALVAEAALPIAVTGSFGRLPGFGVLRMVGRKIRWLRENTDRMRDWLVE